LPGQLVAEAERIAGVPVALYVLDIDGSRLLHMAGAERLAKELPAPLAIGPELDVDGISRLRDTIARDAPAVELFPLWLRGRAIGGFFTFGNSRQPLTEIARQAAASITLADRYSDVFASVQRRKRPRAAAEIQQSLLPPRISRLGGGEVAGNVLPSYEVAGDWFDVAENFDGIWVTLADGLGDSTRAAAASAVALGALRASRRSGGRPAEALLVMHQTLRELPGPLAEMTAVIAHWDPVAQSLRTFNCGHVAPLLIRADDSVEHPARSSSRGLGGRSTPNPIAHETQLEAGDRLVIVSDGVVGNGPGQAGLGEETLAELTLAAPSVSAADAVRAIHGAVIESCEGGLGDDATVVCLLAG
jgi:serine phosphatase RsbU (regulator of sigma subunit)